MMTRLTVNGVAVDASSEDLGHLRDSLFPGCGIIVADGKEATGRTPVREGMTVFFSEGRDLRSEMLKRDDPRVAEVLSKAVIGIAGMGGLGSNVAEMLVRSGATRLVVADLDTVDLSNMNRQNYAMRDLGLPKVEAAERRLREISPFVRIEKHFVRLTPENVPEVFGRCDIVVEAFDAADQKAMLAEAVLGKTRVPMVSGNGMAGIGSTDSMGVRRVSGRLTVCGDGRPDGKVPPRLMSPRVCACAGIMSNEVIRKLIEGNEE